MARHKNTNIYAGVRGHGSFKQTVPGIARFGVLEAYRKYSLRDKEAGGTLWDFAKAPPGVKIFFSNRRKFGVSKSPYNSMNLGFHVGDDPAAVDRNRMRFARGLGLDPSRLTCPRQRHTGIVSVLDREEQVGSGAHTDESVFDPCDGLVTTMENAPILLHFADCLPVVLAGRAGGKPAIGVLHAGRQGLEEGVVANGVKAMVENLGVERGSIVAALGPAIAPCCYEVGEMKTHGFRKRFGGDVVVDGANLDLAAAAIADLKASGVIAERIHLLDICTSCSDDFYSYRREGVTGRHGAIAWISK